MTRAQNSFFNFISSVGASILMIVLNFITRAVFIRVLDVSYQGLEGLFSSILSVLSLTELGFGSAITFKLYRPIEEDDRPRLRVLMKLYRQVYFVIGCVIAALGLALIPFLPKLVKNYGRLAELHLNGGLIFLIYLANSVSSYWFFAYKNAFVGATQKSYVLTVSGYLVSLANSVTQICVLIFTRDFVLYIAVQVVFTILRNILYAVICDRRHPYLKEKTTERVSREELKGFFSDCSALLLYRIANVALDGSDNIVLSTMLGLESNGLYYSYLTVKTSIRTLLNSFFNSLQASLGSLYTTGNLDWSRLMFRVVNLATVCLYGVFSIGIAVLLDDFVAIVWGPDMVVTSWTAAGRTVATPLALFIGIEFYVTGRAYFLSTFRTAMGLFRQMRFRPVINVTVNLAVSVLMVPRMGIAGCVVGTIAAYLSSNLLFDPPLIYKKVLGLPLRRYFLTNLAYDAVTAGALAASWWLCSLIALEGWLGFFVHGCVCVGVTGGIFLLCYCRTEELRYILQAGKQLLRRSGRK